MKASESKHLSLLCDIGELMGALAHSHDVSAFLQRIVGILADHLGAAVCSIYLYEESTDQLVLRATFGLNPGSVGHIRLKEGEGLVGKALAELRVINEPNASKSADFRLFPEAGEEPYDCLLAVPLTRGLERIGVLVVQRETGHPFFPDEVSAMRALASQLVSAIDNARIVLGMSVPAAPAAGPEASRLPAVVNGKVVSSGIAMAPASVCQRDPASDLARQAADLAAAPGSADELSAALETTAGQLQDMQTQLGERLPEMAAMIFDAHLLMLKDGSFVCRMQDLIRGGLPAATAVARVALDQAQRFQAMRHDHMKEKARDVEDLALRLIANLRRRADAAPAMSPGCIVFAADLLPSEILKLAVNDVRGIVLTAGGTTSHVAILARSLRIPMLICQDPNLHRVTDGLPVLLDAETGNLYLAPSEAVTARFKEREHAKLTAEHRKATMREQTATRDGARVHLMANINLLSELKLALELKAEGVGLYRTEFPFLIRDSFPSEEEQRVVYRRLYDAMAGREITVRTLDAGGDKMLSYFNTAGEANPELGLRSTRLLLQNPGIFDQQLRALMGAADPGTTLRIMFPMISSLDEFRAACGRLRDCLAELRVSNPDRVAPRIGAMLELPAVLEFIDEFAQEADFFSIGTNDFVQYMLAADRSNARIASYYCPHHPSVLRALSRLVGAVRRAGKDLSVCGEMANNPRYVPFLIGIGVRKLSVNPDFLPDTQELIGSLDLPATEAAAKRLLQCCTVAETAKLLNISEV